MESKEFLNTRINFLKGIGAVKAEILGKEMGLFKYVDLLKFFPIRYEDRSKVFNYSEIHSNLPNIQLIGRLVKLEIIGQNRKRRLTGTLKLENGAIQLTWFKGIDFFYRSLQLNHIYICFGKPIKFGSGYSITHPEIKEHNQNILQLGLTPIYPSNERLKKIGISNTLIKNAINQVLINTNFKLNEYLNRSITKSNNLISLEAAYKSIHNPKDTHELNNAKKRLVFDEFFFLQYKILRLNKSRKSKLNGLVFELIGNYFKTFYDKHIEFELTNAQKRVIKEIRKDMKSGYQMNRLLQGDVGSGKTIVALMICLIAIDNGFQTVFMAPTEILAMQHFESINNELMNLGINIAVLTGSTKAKERSRISEDLANGNIHILIGTHAVLEEKVRFKNLGLAVIDEQHKFGVAQRSKLWVKNNIVPHILVMTATPIPRTLAMSVYGDLDISVIDELPKGRKEVQTIWRMDKDRLAIMTFLKKEVDAGRQVYIVFPLIEKSKKLDLKDLMNGYNMVVDHFPLPKYQVGIMHGRLNSEEKEKVMTLFQKGITNILISTTVIEVGVNIPNASVMVIENAERFGLSQLHQLRGRVGRGSDNAYCILVSSFKLSRNSRERLTAMVETNNGFEIAAKDLKLRGPGNIEGTKQSGILDLKLADIVKDEAIMLAAKNSIEFLLKDDPELNKEENLYLKKILQKKMQSSGWSRIS